MNSLSWQLLKSDLQKRPLLISLIGAAFLLAITITAVLRASAESRISEKKSAENKDNKFTENISPAIADAFQERNSVNEWSAFAIYHPNSSLSEDALFQTFRGQSAVNEESPGDEEAQDRAKKPRQVLGARSLLPILKTTFGDQVRGNTEIDRDPWFLLHPSALFTPIQLRALCDRDIDSGVDDSIDMCWKPKISEDYLSALTDFASDACPQLVSRESRAGNLLTNKLVRSRDFREQNVRFFALQWLKIPIDKITDDWLEGISNEAHKALQAETQQPMPEGTNPSTALAPEDLYTLACQAVLLSKEFYTR
ncbi:hypothetical protein EBU99_03415 [bacterium]|nr:hypothetical protein [bacterium]